MIMEFGKKKSKDKTTQELTHGEWLYVYLERQLSRKNASP